MPGLKELMEKEKRRREKLDESNKALGFSQAFELGERSNYE
jgi:nucleoporin NUP82